jgi:hypothetical protein
MMTFRSTTRVFPFLAFAAMLVVLAWGSESSSQPAPQKQKGGRPPSEADKKKQQAAKAQEEVARAQETELLRGAYVLLGLANPGYSGHRARAMGHVEAAAKLLHKEGVPKGVKGTHDSPAVSNFLLLRARKVLVDQVRPQAEKKKQSKVLAQVNRAIHEINLALKTRAGANPALKSIEAHVLREAYILMAMANNDYGDHRPKAMRHVEKAVGILDHSILRNGTNGEKVVARKEDIVAARAKFVAANAAAVHEAQLLSNLQMRVAGTLVDNVRLVLVQEKRGQAALGHVDTAFIHIGQALARSQ